MVKRVKKATVKKKQWISISAPKFLNTELGESYVENPENLVGKVIKANLMTVTGDPKKRRYSLSCIITEVTGKTAKTISKSYQIQPSSLKVLIRKGKDRVDHMFVTKSKESDLIVKPLILTKKNTTNSNHTKLRKEIEKLVNNKFKDLNNEDLMSLLIQSRIQKEFKRDLDKVSPISTLEFKVVKIVNKK